MTPTCRILVTNDDGVDSPGLHSLARAAQAAGAEVVVAAPASEASGSGAAITAVEHHGRILLERRVVEDLDAVPVYAVEAAPGLISLIATHGAFGEPPDIVFSGINRGANVGRAIVHSGTVGAAVTAGINDSRGLAVSLDIALEPMGDPQWGTAARLAEQLVPFLCEQPPGTVLNLNVPDVDAGLLDGIREAPLAPFGVVQTTLTEEDEGIVRLGVTDATKPIPPGTDAALLAEGYAVITPLRSVCEAAGPSLTQITSGWAFEMRDDETTPSAPA